MLAVSQPAAGTSKRGARSFVSSHFGWPQPLPPGDAPCDSSLHFDRVRLAEVCSYASSSPARKMTTEYFDEAFYPPDDELFLRTPPPTNRSRNSDTSAEADRGVFGADGEIPVDRESVFGEVQDSDADRESDDEDGLYHEEPFGGAEQEFEDGSFGDEEEVVVASDSYSWRIDHSKGEHKLNGKKAWARNVEVGRTEVMCSKGSDREDEFSAFRQRTGNRHAAEIVHH